LLILCPAWVQAASTVRFTISNRTVGEWAGSVPLTLRRLNDTKAAETMDYATAHGTAPGSSAGTIPPAMPLILL